MIENFANRERLDSVRAKLNATIDAVNAIENQSLPNRSDMVTAIASGFVPVDGATYQIGGLSYRGQTGATAIPDLPGLVPNGLLQPGHFGAVADAVTDDSTPLQNEINRASAIGGGRIHLGSDKLRIDTGLVITGDLVTIEGDGMNAARLIGGTGGMAVLTIGNTTEPAEYNKIRGLTIAPASGVTGVRAIVLQRAFFPVVDDVAFRPSFGGGGGQLACAVDVTNDSGYDITLRDIFCNAIETGLRLGASGSGTRPQNVYQYNTHWNDCSVAGVDVRAVGGFVWKGGETLFCNRGMWIRPGANQQVSAGAVSGVFFDTCDNETLAILPSATTCEVRDWTFTGCGFNQSIDASGIYIAGNSATVGHIEQIRFFGGGNFINKLHGVNLEYCRDVEFHGFNVAGNSRGASGVSSGYRIGAGADDIRIFGGLAGFTDEYPSDQAYGVIIDANAGDVYINATDLTGNVTGRLLGTPSGKLIVKDCPGFVTKAKGVATIATGTSSVTFTHGMSRLPSARTLVKLSYGTDPGAAGWSRPLWVSDMNATTFTVSAISNAANNFTFGWEAESLDW